MKRMKRKAAKPPAKKPVTKAYLLGYMKDLAEKLEWATKIIATNKQEIDRLTALNTKLISAVERMSGKSF